MALLVFPPNPVDGQLYPTSPLFGQNQYQWYASENTWRFLGVATGVTPGVYCAGNTFVPRITVDSVGRISMIDCVELTGFVKLNNAGAYNNYVWPTGGGLAGQVLQTDGFGNLSWTSSVTDPGLGLELNGGFLKVSIPTVSAPPAAGTGQMEAIPGSLYWDNVLGELFVYYDDGVSSQWISATGNGEGIVGPLPGSGLVFPTPAQAVLQTPLNTFSPTSTPLANTVNSTTYVYLPAKNVWVVPSTPGTVSLINTGSGLTGGPITTTGTISLLPATYTTLGGVIPDATNFTLDGLGNLDLTTTTVTPGSYTYSSFTVDAQGRITAASSGVTPNTTVISPITNTGTTIEPIIGIDPATTTQPGAVQLANTLNSTATNLALTAAQGKILQDEIDALIISSNLTLAGTFDAAASDMLTVTPAGTAAGFVLNQDLPAPTAALFDYFVIVTTPGTYTPPGGGGPYTASQGDWFLCDGTQWIYLNVGITYPLASTTQPGIVELATTIETQAGTDATLAVTPQGAAQTYIPLSTLTGKGAVLSASAANTPLALPVGTDGQVLSADSTTPTGLKWTTDGGGTVTSITAGTGLSGGTITTSGTIALKIATSGSLGGVIPDGYSIRVNPFGVIFVCEAQPQILGIIYGCTTTTACEAVLGYMAACSSLGGQANVAVGYCSSALGGTGCGNIAIGCKPLLNTTADFNIAIGAEAGLSVTNGFANVFVGRRAGAFNLAGGCNIGIGFDALRCSPGVFDNIGIGQNALGCLQLGGDLNIGIGCCTGYAISTGDNNIAMGCLSMGTLGIGPSTITGSFNVSLGTLSLANVPLSGNNNVSIGCCSMYGIGAATTSSCNVAIGSSNLMNTSAANANVAIGTCTGNSLTTGSCNILIGCGVLATVPASSTSSFNVGIGHQGYGNIQLVGTSHNVAIGTRAMWGCNGGSILASTNVGIGKCSLYAVGDACFNVAIGNCPAFCLTTGNDNIAVGSCSAQSVTTGLRNIAMGCLSMGASGGTTGCDNIGIGTCTYGNIQLTNCHNISVGTEAMWGASGGVNTAHHNVAIGQCSLYSIENSFNNIGIGTCAGCGITTGRFNIGIGCEAVGSGPTTGTFNIGIGIYAGRSVTAGCGNISMGCLAGADNLIGNDNVGIGTSAMAGADDTNCSIGIGYYAFASAQAGANNNVSIGSYTGNSISTGVRNIVMGFCTLAKSPEGTAGCDHVGIGTCVFGNVHLSSCHNVAIGTCSMWGAAGGTNGASWNVAIGRSAYYCGTGFSNVAIGGEAGCGLTTANETIAIGYEAISSGPTTGRRNIGIGSNSGAVLTSGCSNTYIGTNTGNFNKTGECNIAIGDYAMSGSLNNNRNIAIGSNALTSNNDPASNDNIVLGTCAGGSIFSGARNIVMGCQAMSSVTGTTGFDNIGIGTCSFGNVQLTNSGNTYEGVNNVAIGQCAMFGVGGTSTAGFNVAVGFNALAKGTGYDNIAIGDAAGCGITAADENIAVGLWAMCGGPVTGRRNISLGTNSAQALTTGCSNIYVGTNSGNFNKTGQCNIAIGDYAMSGSLNNNRNIAIGANALTSNNDPASNDNIAVGTCAGQSIFTGARNIIMGCQALAGINGTTGCDNIGIGTCTYGNVQLTKCENIAIGCCAMWGKAGGVNDTYNNVAIGSCTLAAVRTGATDNIGIGSSAGCGITTGELNVAIGYCTQTADSTTVQTGSCNVSIGYLAGRRITTGEQNVFIGPVAGEAPNNAGSCNVGIGSYAMSNACGCANVAIGANAFTGADPTAANNIAIGTRSGGSIYCGLRNIAIGNLAMYYTSGGPETAKDNIGIGTSAMGEGTWVGGCNIGIGCQALAGAGPFAVSRDGSKNVAIGFQAGFFAGRGTASDNVFIGTQAGCSLGTGSCNVVIGACSNLPISTVCCSVLIGPGISVGGNCLLSIGYGLGCCWIIGSPDLSVKFGGGFRDGTNSLGAANTALLSTGTNTAWTPIVRTLAAGTGISVSAATGAVTVTNTGVTSVSAGGGISVSASTGAVTITNTSPSDARDKQNIRDNALGLDFVNDLRTTYFEWNFRKTDQDKGKPNVGFIAQEIQEVVAKHDAQALNLVDESDPEFLKLTMVNFMPVAIKAIQEMSEKYEARIAELEARIAALEIQS